MKNFIYSISMLSILISSGCNDIIETDLTDRGMVLIAPQNNLETSQASHIFLWEEVEGALQYHFQIANPSFDMISTIEADETLKNNQYSFTLNPGVYQWRVRAENGSSRSSYYTFNIEIDSSGVLTGQNPILNYPPNNIILNTTTITFDWDNMSAADSYRLQLDNTGSSDDLDTTVYTNTPTVFAIPEGDYVWYVNGENSTTFSNTVSRSFIVDITVPTDPILIFPQADTTLAAGFIDFQWTSGTDTYFAYDSIYIYENTQTLLSGFPKLATEIYRDSLGSGDFWWRVKSFDQAGNSSAFSEKRKITFN